MSDSNNTGGLFSLNNKVIFITGAYGLLGKEFAKTVSSAGAKTVIGGRDIAKAREVAKLCDGYAVEIDVSEKKSVSAAVDEITGRFGTIDGLINNASFSSPASTEGDNFAPFEEYSENSWRKSFDVDVSGMFFCAQSVGKVMAESNGGNIVNVSSIYGILSPDPSIYEEIKDDKGRKYVKPVGYCVAKSAVINLTRYLAVYYRGKNIRANTLTLGGVYDSQENSFVEAYGKKTALGRMAKADEYNGAILFLLSDASSYMTGSNLILDGGLSAW